MERSPCQFALDIFTDREATFGLVFANIVFIMKMFPRLRVRSLAQNISHPRQCGPVSDLSGAGEHLKEFH